MQILLSSPNITCDHCIETIRGVVDATDGARLISGNPDAKTFTVDVASGALLDVLATRLAAADYPLGDVTTDAHHGATADRATWRPSAYRVEKTEVGANINYDCYCSCDAGFALDRSNADPALESCCCGNQILVGAGAGARITSKLDAPDAYRIDVQQVTMPWGQPLEVALAIPLEA
ncbi:MAG: copper chaperone [Dehalococcoidia bacterium]|nr:MAG: copper chaperone [Dehalococcoidia bacterium]